MAISSVVYEVLLRPLPYPCAEQIVQLREPLALMSAGRRASNGTLVKKIRQRI
jgi:hypothetical protein